MSLWEVPTSVFEAKILSSLSVRDLASLGKVSKQFRDEVQAESVWEAMYHHRYGPRTLIIKRAAEIAGGYRQLCRSRLLSDRASGPGVHRATEAEEAAFVESVVGSGDMEKGPASLILLVDTSQSMTSGEDYASPAVGLASKLVSAALRKSPSCRTGAIQFQRDAVITLPLKLHQTREFGSSVSNLFEVNHWCDLCGSSQGAHDSNLGSGAHLAPAMALVRKDIVRVNLPLDAPKFVVVMSDGLWSPAEVAEAQAAAAELCRGDVGPVRVFGVGVGKAARMDEFRGMLEAQGSLPPQASARYLTLLSSMRPATVTYDLSDLCDDDAMGLLAVLERRLGLELDDETEHGSPGALCGPPPAWLVARLPPHRLRLTLEPSGEGDNPILYKRVLTLAPWVEGIRVMPGEDYADFVPAPLPYSQQELQSFSNLRELSLFDPYSDSVPALPSLECLDLFGLFESIDFYSQFKGLTSLKRLKIDAFDVNDPDYTTDLVEELYDAVTVFKKLELMSLNLPGPVWTLPDFSSCKDTLKSFSFTYADNVSPLAERQTMRQGWLADAESALDLVTVSDVAAALSDCASLESLEFVVMSDKGLEGIKDLAGLPSLKTLPLVCSLPRAELEEGQAQLLKAFSALKQIETIVLCESPNAKLSDWRCEHSWKEGTLAVKTVLKEQG